MATQSLNRAVSTSADEGLWRLTPWVSRLLLLPPALIVFLISFRSILDPIHAASETGVTLSTPEALTDTRALDGITLTLAVVLLWNLFSRTRLRMGHALVVTLMLLVLSARIFGFVKDGTTLETGTQKTKTRGEVVFLALNAAGFALQTYRTRRRSLG
jgi:hypothetical protein